MKIIFTKTESSGFAPPEMINVFRFDGFDDGVACLIFGIEGQQIFDGWTLSQRRHSCVADLNARDGDAWIFNGDRKHFAQIADNYR